MTEFIVVGKPKAKGRVRYDEKTAALKLIKWTLKSGFISKHQAKTIKGQVLKGQITNIDRTLDKAAEKYARLNY